MEAKELDVVLEYTLFDEMNCEKALFLSWKQFGEISSILAKKVANIHLRQSFDAVYALPKGGLCFGAVLAYRLGIPLLMDSSSVTKRTLIADNCVKTGKTLASFTTQVKVVLFYHPDSSVVPDLYFRKTHKKINFCWELKSERN